jgi:hypothetical protein
MGFAAALNLGIRASRAPRVGFLLTDDWLEPEAVERSLESDADIVSTGRTFWAADGVSMLPQLTRTRSRNEFETLDPLYEKACWLGYFLLFQKKALEAAGGVDETLGDSPGVDDFDLLWTMLERGATVGIVEERLYNVRDHAGERLTTRSKAAMLATFTRILDKHGVTAAEREYLLREHTPWFGRTMMETYRERERQAAQPSGWLARAEAKWRAFF